MYLSGPPLHVLALTLAHRFREAHPDLPITFSAGIDASNAAGVIEAGAHGVAVISAILSARDPGEAATALLRATGQTASR